MIQIGDVKAYNVKQVSKMLSMSEKTIRKYLSDGKIKGRKIGVSWYVTEDSLEGFLKESDN